MTIWNNSKALIVVVASTAAIVGWGADNSSIGFRSAANSPWATLALDKDGIAEVAVDFRIEEFQIGSNGDAQMVFKTAIDKREIGFSVKISNPKKSEIETTDGETVVVMNSIITVTSIGEPTKALEKLLKAQLRGGAWVGGQPGLTGIYNADSESRWVNFAYPFVFNLRGNGQTFDGSGKLESIDVLWQYLLKFIIDGPRKRATAYISVSAGYGGTNPVTTARNHWLGEIKK